MANERPRRILLTLEREHDWMTASTLASALGCSVRTVKGDISRLNTSFPGVIESGGKGYRISDASQLERALTKHPESIPQTAVERRSYILRMLLMEHSRVSPSSLADELCISQATLDNELVAIKEEMWEYGLGLRLRGGLLFVLGGEAKEKRLLNRLIFDETKDFFNQVDLVSRYFPDIDLRMLRDSINGVLEGSRYYINGYALSNLVMHVAVMLERKFNGFPDVGEEGPRYNADLASSEMSALVAAVCRCIEEVGDVTLSCLERDNIGMLLSTSLLDSSLLAPNKMLNERIFDVTQHVCHRLALELDLPLRRMDFETRFALHISNLVERAHAGIVLKNPQLRSIKDGYPFVYDMAVVAAETISQDTGVNVSEDEIAYIALHIGCLIEEEGAARSKLFTTLVFPRHDPGHDLFIDRFRSSFDQALEISEVVDSSESISPYLRSDLVVTVEPGARLPGGPEVVQVSPFLGERDVLNVNRAVERVRRRGFREALRSNLYEYFKRDLFFPNPDFKDSSDAIETLSQALIEGGYAYENLKGQLYERERISSSAYRDIAIPHALEMDARKTAVAVSLHPTPIDWNGTPVYVVLMLAVRRGERTVFRSVFESVTTALNEPGCSKRLAQAQSFDEFVQTILSYV